MRRAAPEAGDSREHEGQPAQEDSSEAPPEIRGAP